MLYFLIQNRFQDRTSKVSEAAGARWRFHGRTMVGSWSDQGRIILGLSSNRLYIGGSNSESFRCNLELADFVAGAVFAEVGGWHCLLCALVSYEARINHEIHFAWQAQYLLRFEVDFACSAHSKWRFICDADQSWDAFCVAGAVFGEVGVWLFVAGTAFGDILGDSRSAKCCIFQYKIVFKVGRVRSPTRRVRDAIFWSDCRRIIVGLSSNRLSIGGSNSRSFRWSLELTDFVAGAVFGEVGGWLCMLRAL